MIISVIVRDMQRKCEIPIPFQPSAFVIALERGLSTSGFWYVGPSIAPHLFLLSLTVAGDHDLERA